MTASSVPAVKTALLALCQTAITDTDVQFCYGHPGTNRANSVVSVRDALSRSDWGALGARQKDEQLQVELVVSCRQGGTNQQEITEKAFDYLDLIDAELRTDTYDASVSGSVLWGHIAEVQLRESNPNTHDMTKGRVAELFCTVTATNII